MSNPDVHLFHVDAVDFSAFTELLERHHIDIIVDGGLPGEGDFSSESLAELCAAYGFGYLPRGEQLDPNHAGPAAFQVSAGAITELSHSGRVLVMNPDPTLPSVLEASGLNVLELSSNGTVGPYQRHLDLDDKGSVIPPP